MKIKNWDKISGFTYKGYSIVNPMHNADETKYYATILNLNIPHKPKLSLSVLTPDHKFINDSQFFITLMEENTGLSTRMYAIKENISTLAKFVILYEQMIERIIALNQTNTYSSHSFGSGLMNMIYNNGNTIKI